VKQIEVTGIAKGVDLKSLILLRDLVWQRLQLKKKNHVTIALWAYRETLSPMEAFVVTGGRVGVAGMSQASEKLAINTQWSSKTGCPAALCSPLLDVTLVMLVVLEKS
jgi:hypothetical protein